MPDDYTLQRRVEVARAVAEMRASRGLLDYLNHVVINKVPEPKKFAEVAEPWQWQLAKTYAPRLDWLAGNQAEETGAKCFWFTLPRGHDKTGSIGRAMNYLLRFSKRPLELVVGARDKDQAGIILQSMKTERTLNPFLKPLDFDKWEVTGPGGRMRVLAADAPSVYGETLDFMLMEEPTHWTRPDLFNALWSGRHKRPGACFMVLSNAGEKGTWQWDTLQIAKSSDIWHVWEAPERVQLASWMTTAEVAETRKFLPPGLARRVIDNVWIDANEEKGWVTYAEALQCLDTSLLPCFSGDQAVHYFAGIDYGPKRDRTALVILHREGDASVVVDHLTVWQGSPDQPVQIKAVDDWIDNVAIRQFNADLVVDPYQMEASIQKYEHVHKVIRFEPRGGKSNYELAENLRSLIVNQRLRYPLGAGTLTLPNGQVETLTQELSEVVACPTSYGYRIDTPSKKTKDRRTVHDDRTVALGMASLLAIRDQIGGVDRRAEKSPTVRGGGVAAAQRAALALDRGEGWGLYGGEAFGLVDWREVL